MHETLTTHNVMNTYLVRLLFASAFLFLHSAIAQTDVSGLTDDELVEQFHRESYRDEFFRRLRTYTPEQRKAATAKVWENTNRRRFPQEFTDEELFGYLQRPGDRKSRFKAQAELLKRFREPSPDEIDYLVSRLRIAFEDTPYPVVDSPGFDANFAAYSSLTSIVTECLPEEAALSLLKEVYLDSGQKHSITLFLTYLRNDLFTGEATMAVLEDLATQIANYDASDLTAMRENESLHGMVGNLIRQRSDNSFEAVKAREWQNDSHDIAILGTFNNPEARELLLAHYDTLPEDGRFPEQRLKILSALTEHGNRNPDAELKIRLRVELTAILEMDHTQNPYTIGRTAFVIGKTSDPYFVPVLKRKRADLDVAAIRAISTLPEDQLEDTIKGVYSGLDTAITKLESIQSE